MAANKVFPASYFPIATHRKEGPDTFLPGKLRAKAPALKIKNPVILEADAVLLDSTPPDWLSADESKASHRVNTAYPEPSLEAALQIPSYLRQTFIEAYLRQADPRWDLPFKGERVNLTA